MELFGRFSSCKGSLASKSLRTPALNNYCLAYGLELEALLPPSFSVTFTCYSLLLEQYLPFMLGKQTLPVKVTPLCPFCLSTP